MSRLASISGMQRQEQRKEDPMGVSNMIQHTIYLDVSAGGIVRSCT